MRWERIALLSEQQIELLRFAREHGTESKVIAAQCDYAPTTIDTYMSEIRRALGVTSRPAAVRLLAEWEACSRDSRSRLRDLARTAPSPDAFDQAIDVDMLRGEDREAGGLRILREERALFEIPIPSSPWWHPSQWGRDVTLNPREVLILIVKLAALFIVAGFVILASAESLQRTLVALVHGQD
jgi:DNA-binding CsgD family transcriptional regulator